MSDASRPGAGLLRIDDDREYAWLLERDGTLLEILATSIVPPPEPGEGRLRRVSLGVLDLGFRVALALFLLVLAIGMIVAFSVGPAAVFLLLRPLAPAWVWWMLVSAAQAVILFLMLTWALEWVAQDPLPSEEVGDQGPWRRMESLNMLHESSRAFAFGAAFMLSGWCVAVAMVLLGDWAFAGPTGGFGPWLLHFGHLAIDTILLGMLGTVLDPPGGIEPVNGPGRALSVALRLAVAAGATSLAVHVFSGEFRPRELFRGTVRNLADHVENTDLSKGEDLRIHRIAVVRPLPKDEVLTVTKDDFFRVIAEGEPSDETPFSDPAPDPRS